MYFYFKIFNIERKIEKYDLCNIYFKKILDFKNKVKVFKSYI